MADRRLIRDIHMADRRLIRDIQITNGSVEPDYQTDFLAE